MLLHHLDQLALGQFDAVEQRLDARIRLVADLVVERLQRALHVVGDRQDIARKIGDAVGARVGHLALGAAAQIFHLGQRAQQAVLQARGLLGERRDRIGRCFGGLCGLGVLGRGLSPVRAVVSVIIQSISKCVEFAPDIRAEGAKIKPS